MTNVVDALRAAANLSSEYQPPCWLEQSPDLPPHEILPCSNGLLHLPEKILLPPSSLFFCQHALDYPFDADALDPENWLQFLDQLWGGNNLLARFSGTPSKYVLNSDISRISR